MFIFALFIIISLVMYIYYKVAILRSKDELIQVYTNAKARICLGGFVFFFGINQYIFYQTKVSLLFGFVFLALGGMQIIRGYKEMVHYKKEWRRLHPNE
ncbi:MAG TPA: YtpI family protein [Bacillota bacterium]|nr:YtpI family protein [Bacillota bacterium]